MRTINLEGLLRSKQTRRDKDIAGTSPNASFWNGH